MWVGQFHAHLAHSHSQRLIPPQKGLLQSARRSRGVSKMQPLSAATLVVALLLLRQMGVESRVDGFRNKASSPPPGYKNSAFRLIVPEAGLATLPWHSALKHAAFLSLRRKFSSFADGSHAERNLWEQLSGAPVYPSHLRQPEREDADLSILANGLLVREGGQLFFAPEDILLYPSAIPRKVSAIWSVIRVRHSGPGLKAPKIEFYFTVTPASHLSMMNHIENRFKGFQKNPYDGPFFDHRPGHFYHPLFINSYKQSVQSFVNSYPEEETSNLAKEARDEVVAFKQEPIYIIPSPRLVRPDFDRVENNVERSIATEDPNIIKLKVQKISGEDSAESKTVTEKTVETEDAGVAETTTKFSSKYRDTSKESQ